jgi:hypothetical protein
VVVSEGETHHHVTMSRETCERLAGKHTPEHCREAVFRFLLDRKSILGRFNVTVISRYFPEWSAGLWRKPRSKWVTFRSEILQYRGFDANMISVR